MNMQKHARFANGRSAILAAVIVLAGAVASNAEDGYIVNSVTNQYINTGYFIGPNTKIELDFQLMESVNQARLFGMMGSNGDVDSPICECYIGSDGQGTHKLSMLCSSSEGAQQGVNLYPTDLDRHKVVVDLTASERQFQVWTDGEMVASKTFASVANTTSSYPLALFGKNYRTTGLYSSKLTAFAYPAKMKVYSFKIWDSGVLVRNFEPCVKGGMAGFKDACSGVFYSGENTRACTAGGDVPIEKDDPYIYSPRNTLAAKAARSVFIDTGYTVTPNSRVELDFAMLTDDWATDNLYSPEPYILGALDNSGTAQFMYMTACSSDADKGRFYYRLGTATETMVHNTFGIDTAYGVRRTVSMDKSSIRIITAGFTNVVSTVADGKEITIDLATHTLKIGASYTGESRFLPMKVYGLKIYESDSLVKDYMPFVASGVAGLTNSLDSSDTIYVSTYGSNGTACIDAGGDVSDPSGTPEAYLEFDGVAAHSINTGVTITKDSCVECDMELWSSDYNTQQFFFEQRGYNSNTSKCNGVWLRLYNNSKWAYSFRDYSFNVDKNGKLNHGSFTSTGVATRPNQRLQFKFDGVTGKASVMEGTTVLYDATMPGTRTWTTCTTNFWIGSSWSGSGNPSCMRVYSFKISESGVLQRNFVPCVKDGDAGLYDLCGNKFYPVEGGKVSGMTLNGDTFRIAPQPAKLLHKDGFDSTTLTCLALGGAQSYEWYVDGVKIEGETSDSYTVNWEKIPAPYTRTYSVKPVYSVFNEKVLGNAVSAVVEMAPRGTVVVIK